jgi:hypothetical protein
MASVVLGEEIDPRVGIALAALTAAAAGMSFACAHWGHCPPRRVLDQRGAVTAR